MVATAAAVVSAVSARAAALQVFGRYVAHRYDLDVEVERLAGHRVVEVHLHGLLADLLDDAHHAVALIVAHRNLRTHEEDVLGEFAVHHEYVFGQVYHGVGDQFAVTVLRLKGKRDSFADLLAQNRLFEFGEQHACSEDKFERLARTRLVCDLSVDGELVVHADHFVLFYFHNNSLKNVFSFSLFPPGFPPVVPGLRFRPDFRPAFPPAGLGSRSVSALRLPLRGLSVSACLFSACGYFRIRQKTRLPEPGRWLAALRRPPPGPFFRTAGGSVSGGIRAVRAAKLHIIP